MNKVNITIILIISTVVLYLFSYNYLNKEVGINKIIAVEKIVSEIVKVKKDFQEENSKRKIFYPHSFELGSKGFLLKKSDLNSLEVFIKNIIKDKKITNFEFLCLKHKISKIKKQNIEEKTNEEIKYKIEKMNKISKHK